MKSYILLAVFCILNLDLKSETVKIWQGLEAGKGAETGCAGARFETEGVQGGPVGTPCRP